MGWIKDIFDIAEKLLRDRKEAREEATHVRTGSKAAGKGDPLETNHGHEYRGSHGITWEEYQKLFDLDGYRVPYITLINEWKNQALFLEQTSLKLKQIHERFSVPNEFKSTPVPDAAFDGACCRLVAYRTNDDHSLEVTIQETGYYDYLRSGEHLDDPFPSDTKITNREAFGRIVENGNGDLWPFESLTNICGTGIFIISADMNGEVLIVSKLPPNSHVYPGRWTFSASGVIPWGSSPDPFGEIVRKADKELNHQIDIRRARLVGFGADARKLYFEFSFVERTTATSSQLIAELPDTNLEIKSIPWRLDSILDQLLEECWEPAAEAALLTLCANEFGREQVTHALFGRHSLWEKREMRDEWDYRASRPGDLPDMSLRYPPELLKSESDRYVTAVLAFIGNAVHGRDVVEIGPGTGRITERLVSTVGHLTCVDFCEHMKARCERRLGSLFNNLTYVLSFAQEYFPQQKHDIAICSLVLVHNVDDSLFRKLVARLCGIADTVFVFEDVTIGRPTSPRTRLRNKGQICDSFLEAGLRKTKEMEFKLFDDDIVFLEFVRG